MQMTTHKFKLHARRNPAVILISRHFLISASLPRNPSCYLVVSMTHQPLCDNLNLRCLLIVPLNDKLKAPLIVVVSNYICLLMLLLFVRPGHDGLFPVWNPPFAYPSIQSRSEKILQPEWPKQHVSNLQQARQLSQSITSSTFPLLYSNMQMLLYTLFHVDFRARFHLYPPSTTTTCTTFNSYDAFHSTYSSGLK